MYSSVLKPGVTDYTVFIILLKALLRCRPSFSSAAPASEIQSLRLKLNIYWIKSSIWREIVFRCCPAASGQCCTCGSDLVTLVKTEVWSSVTRRCWLTKEAFALCDRSQPPKLCRFLFLVIICGLLLPAVHIRMTVWHQADAVQIWCWRHRLRALLILMICPSQAWHIEFPSTDWSLRCLLCVSWS